RVEHHAAAGGQAALFEEWFHPCVAGRTCRRAPPAGRDRGGWVGTAHGPDSGGAGSGWLSANAVTARPPPLPGRPLWSPSRGLLQRSSEAMADHMRSRLNLRDRPPILRALFTVGCSGGPRLRMRNRERLAT